MTFHIVLLLCLFGTLAHADEAVPPSLQRIVQDYEGSLRQVRSTRDNAVTHAWRQADQRLEALLAETMKRGDLEESNRLHALRAELELLHAGKPVAAASTPRTPIAAGLKAQYLTAKQQADSEYFSAMQKAGRAAIEAMDAAAKTVLRDGGLEEANRVSAYKKRFEVQLKLAGRFPGGAQVIYTFDRETFFKQGAKELVRDISGNDNHLVAENVKAVPGRVGTAVAFAGDKSKLVSQLPIGIAGASPRSVSFWAYFDPAPTGEWRHFLGWGKAKEKQSFYASTYRGRYQLWAFGFGNDWTVEIKAQAKTWQHHLIAYDGKKVQWLVDGRPLENGWTLEYATVDTVLTLGGTPVTLDEVAIYPRVLGAEEIRVLMTRPEPAK